MCLSLFRALVTQFIPNGDLFGTWHCDWKGHDPGTISDEDLAIP